MTEAMTENDRAAEREAARKDRLRLRIGQHLSGIVELYGDLETEATHRFADRDLPGGDALVMLGPSANMEAWQHRIDAAEARYFEAIEEGRTASWPEIADEDSDPAPPLLVLGTWEDAVRDERDQPTYLRASVESAAKYLRDSIDWMLSDNEYGEPNFIAIDELARDLGALRRRLEAILKDGSRPELTRVNCIADECGERPRLHKVYGAKAAWDHYKCPACRTQYDLGQFEIAKAQNLHADGTERFVLLTQAIEATGVPKPTMHSWVRRLGVRACCEIKSRRVMVWWPDVRERAEQRRQARAAVTS